jgi:hypothetical protein
MALPPILAGLGGVSTLVFIVRTTSALLLFAGDGWGCDVRLLGAIDVILLCAGNLW